MSIRAYARHRGVSDTAVRKAIITGRITPETDGTVDASRADRDWALNTESPRTGTQKRAVRVPASAAVLTSHALTRPLTVGAQAQSDPPMGVVPAAEESADESQATAGTLPGGTSLLQARTVNEVVKAQTNKVRLARLKGELVDRNQAIAHVFRLARSERDAWLNWPARVAAELAARLQVEAHPVHVALDAAVREHLQELGDMRPRVD